MNILLSYSKAHFDPDKKPSDQKHWGSSANVLARALYETLQECGTVTYVDRHDVDQVAGKTFDLFVGIQGNFNQFLNRCTIKKSVLFAVNMHPKERNKRLLSFISKNHLSPSALCSWDLIYPREWNAATRADYIIGVGNNTLHGSYVRQGVPYNNIATINYSTSDKAPTSTPKTLKKDEVIRIIHVTSEIGLRKGFPIVRELISKLSGSFHLDLVGLPTNNYHKKHLEKFVASHKGTVSYHGWLAADSQEYTDIIKKAHYLLFPSLEEGQAGTVIDCISHGVVPIITSESGIDFSPLGLLEAKLGSRHNLRILEHAINQTPEEYKKLSLRTLEYHSLYHATFKKQLREALQRAISGQLYPKFSIVLPIFNKERTIEGLIALLHQSCQTYGNCEVHIIFDGCKDKTEEKVRALYKKLSPTYEVRYSVTPNIFEVKSNNLGLKAATGKYAAIIQDDNYLFDPYWMFEAASFLEKNETCAVLGGLAGVNFYNRGTKLEGKGQITMNSDEVYWRQDAATDPSFTQKVYQVDACMRGPLIIRKSFLEEYGYLDEVFAPLYQDDMDFCMRVAAKGYHVYTMLMNVQNKSLTMANFSSKKWEYFSKVMKTNLDVFYKRWTFTKEKDYPWIYRSKFYRKPRLASTLLRTRHDYLDMTELKIGTIRHLSAIKQRVIRRKATV